MSKQRFTTDLKKKKCFRSENGHVNNLFLSCFSGLKETWKSVDYSSKRVGNHRDQWQRGGDGIWFGGCVVKIGVLCAHLKKKTTKQEEKWEKWRCRLSRFGYVSCGYLSSPSWPTLASLLLITVSFPRKIRIQQLCLFNGAGGCVLPHHIFLYSGWSVFFFSIVLLSPSAVWRPSWTHTHL